MAAVPTATKLPAVSRIGAAIIACACVFVLTYLALRGAAGEVRRDASTLACYRAELQRRRDLLARVTRWYLAPFWPGLALYHLGIVAEHWGEPGAAGKLMLAIGITVVVNVGIAVVNRRGAAKLTRELEALPSPEAPQAPSRS